MRARLGVFPQVKNSVMNVTLTCQVAHGDTIGSTHRPSPERPRDMATKDLTHLMKASLVDRSRVPRGTADALARRGLIVPIADTAKRWMGGYAITLTPAGEQARDALIPQVGARVRNIRTGLLATVQDVQHSDLFDIAVIRIDGWSEDTAGSPAYLEIVEPVAEQRDGAEWAAAPAEPSRSAVERYRRARVGDAEPVVELPRGHMNMTGPDGRLRHRVTYTRKPLCDQRQDWSMLPLGAVGPVNCPPCVLAEHRTEKDAAYWVTGARRLQGWQEPRDVPEWWPPVELGTLVEITPPMVPIRVRKLESVRDPIDRWALGYLINAVDAFVSEFPSDTLPVVDLLRDKLAHVVECAASADEFEQGYAERSRLTVAELRAMGRTVAPCGCGEPDCPGWQSVKWTELNGETR